MLFNKKSLPFLAKLLRSEYFTSVKLLPQKTATFYFLGSVEFSEILSLIFNSNPNTDPKILKN